MIGSKALPKKAQNISVIGSMKLLTTYVTIESDRNIAGGNLLDRTFNTDILDLIITHEPIFLSHMSVERRKGMIKVK